jgi:ATP-binding protein involved in chromosome partitioning
MHEIEPKLLRPQIGAILLVMSNKGGVGKSTVAVNLAISLSRRFKVGLLDGDIHGPSITKMLGIDHRKVPTMQNRIIAPVDHYGLKVLSLAMFSENDDQAVLWRGPMKANLLAQFTTGTDWGGIDVLVVDLPPGTGDEAMSLAQQSVKIGRTGIVLVTTPQEVALFDARKCVDFGKQLSVPIIGVIENMASWRCPSCGVQHQLFGVDGGRKAAAEFSLAFLGSLPFDPVIVQSGDTGRPFAGDSQLPISEAFNTIIGPLREWIAKDKEEAHAPGA